jgi:hypothetical protein
MRLKVDFGGGGGGIRRAQAALHARQEDELA